MVAALNAAKWWNLPRVPSQDSPEWQRWIRRCGARYGAATRVELLHRHLGLAAVDLIPETYSINDAIQQGIPVEATIWISTLGLHAVLLVPGRDDKRKPCTVALGLIRAHRHPKVTTGARGQKGTALDKSHEYVSAKVSVEKLLANYCFPIGNPNRRFRALVPLSFRVLTSTQNARRMPRRTS